MINCNYNQTNFRSTSFPEYLPAFFVPLSYLKMRKEALVTRLISSLRLKTGVNRNLCWFPSVLHVGNNLHFDTTHISHSGQIYAQENI